MSVNLPLFGFNIIFFMGTFLIAEAIFSIIYYFKGSALPHLFRVIRAIFGFYLVWAGANYTILDPKLWSEVPLFFAIVVLCILAGYELAITLEKRK